VGRRAGSAGGSLVLSAAVVLRRGPVRTRYTVANSVALMMRVDAARYQTVLASAPALAACMLAAKNRTKLR
jgi:hypothetical protein